MDAIFNFVKNFSHTRYEDIPKDAIDAARKEVLDSLATALAGSKKEGVGELVDLIKEWGGAEQSSIIGYGIKCPAPNAAQVNGTMIHALDYDDGHPVALVHIGCVAVSTCYAVAERMGKIKGKELITALALGADFMARLGLASRPGTSALSSGFHPTTLFGFLGAAAMAGKIMGLDDEGMVNALGLAYHQCGGAGSGVSDGALAKRMGPGLAAKSGITAALMAERGITGDRSPLEGRTGLFNQYMRGDYDLKILTSDLGKRFEGANIGDKPYPCCGLTHAFIDATLSLRQSHSIKTDHVQEIKVFAGQSGYELSQPPEVKNSPRSIVDAQFSVPWVVATAIVKGKVTLEDFTDEGIKQKSILEITPKITAQLDPDMSRHGVEPGRVKIVMKDGTEYNEHVEHCLGSIERPMKFEDCVRKFRECSAFSIKPLSSERMEKVIDMIDRLGQLDDATEIIRSLG